MKLISADRQQCVLQFDETERWRKAFIFDVSLIVDAPNTKTLVIRDPRNHKRTWQMSWRKFLRGRYAFDNVVLLQKTEMKYETA